MTSILKLIALILFIATTSCQHTEGKVSLDNVDTSSYEQIPALVPYREGTLWGFSNAEGEMIIPARFYSAKILSDSLFAGYDINGEHKTYLYNAHAQLIDTYDSEVDYLLLGKSKTYPYVNDKLFLFYKYSEHRFVGSGMQHSGDREAYIYNKEGHFQFDSTGYQIEEFPSNKELLAIGKYSGKTLRWGLVDTSGKLIKPISFDKADILRYLAEHIKNKELEWERSLVADTLEIAFEGNWRGVYNRNKKRQIVPATYDSISMTYAQDVFGKYEHADIIALKNNITDIYTVAGRKIFSTDRKVVVKANYSAYTVLETDDGFANILDTTGRLVARIAKADKYGLIKTGYLLATYDDSTIAVKLGNGAVKKLKGVLMHIHTFATIDVPYIVSAYDDKIAVFDPTTFNQVLPYVFSKGDYDMAYGQVINDGNPIPGLYWVSFQYDRNMWRGKGYMNSKGFKYWKD